MRTLPALAALALAAFALAVAPAHAAPATTLTLLAVSDWHGTAEHGIWGGLDENDESEASREWAWQIPGGERLGCAIAAEKARDPDMVLVAAGDMITDATTRPVYGAGSWPAVEAMNRMGIRWSAFGNHETNEGPDVWNRWAERLNTRYLAANAPGTWVEQASAKHPAYGPGVAIETVKGIRIAYVGVMVEAPPGSAAYYGAGDQLEGKIGNPQATANRLAARIKGEGAADVVVVLAHVGLRAETYPADWEGEAFVPDTGWGADIDVVVGGHTHRTFKVVQRDGRQVLVEPSSYGRVLGRIELTMAGSEVARVHARYVKTEDACGVDHYGLAALEGRVAQYRRTLGQADLGVLASARAAALGTGQWGGTPGASAVPEALSRAVAPELARKAVRAGTDAAVDPAPLAAPASSVPQVELLPASSAPQESHASVDDSPASVHDSPAPAPKGPAPPWRAPPEDTTPTSRSPTLKHAGSPTPMPLPLRGPLPRRAPPRAGSCLSLGPSQEQGQRPCWPSA